MRGLTSPVISRYAEGNPQKVISVCPKASTSLWIMVRSPLLCWLIAAVSNRDSQESWMSEASRNRSQKITRPDGRHAETAFHRPTRYSPDLELESQPVTSSEALQATVLGQPQSRNSSQKGVVGKSIYDNESRLQW